MSLLEHPPKKILIVLGVGVHRVKNVHAIGVVSSHQKIVIEDMLVVRLVVGKDCAQPHDAGFRPCFVAVTVSGHRDGREAGL